MIHVAIGTKAQFIKMAPILRALQEKGIEFNLIDLGQHALITRDLRRELQLKTPDVSLSRGENVSRIGQGFRWGFALAAKGFSARRAKKEIFRDRPGVCLIHGDTVSTVLALFLAKRAGVAVAHVEAGLRSFDLLEPFPEELVRRVVMRFSDLLFAPSRWADANLRRMGYGAKSILLSANTSFEAAVRGRSANARTEPVPGRYALVTVHRMENIFSRRRLGFVLELVERIAAQMPVVFVQHQATLHRLEKLGLQHRLERIDNLKLLRLLSHGQFLRLLENAEFVVTDGGSIQEESYYLGKPCLLLRRATERMEGVGQNVVLTGCDPAVARRFIRSYPDFRRRPQSLPATMPSGEIIAHLQPFTRT